VTRARRLRVIVEADGGARGNPGPAGYGAVVREAATGEVLMETAQAIGVATNNVAEYSGLVAGLQAAADLGAVEVEVRMDSKLVVEQMSGRWQIKHPGLRPLAVKAAALVRRFDTVRFVWVPRERNRRADALANAAMDGKDAPAVDLAPRPGAAAPGVRRDERPRSWEPRPSSSATRLILVRHGETKLTAQRRYSGRGDVPLSARGQAQSIATATRVASLGEIAGVATSPLRRCADLAERIAAEAGGVPVQVEPDLIECDFGEWEGLTFGDVRDRWPDQLDAWLGSPSTAPPGGESFEAVDTRVRGVIGGLLAAFEGQRIVVVSHVTPIKLILRDALAAGDALLHRLYLDPAGISIVDVWPDGGIAVRTVNDTAHVVSVGDDQGHVGDLGADGDRRELR
jgi:ribonuclease H / adenosylcobalamin/alpha-ribazole phosphatase